MITFICTFSFTYNFTHVTERECDCAPPPLLVWTGLWSRPLGGKTCWEGLCQYTLYMKEHSGKWAVIGHFQYWSKFSVSKIYCSSWLFFKFPSCGQRVCNHSQTILSRKEEAEGKKRTLKCLGCWKFKKRNKSWFFLFFSFFFSYILGSQSALSQALTNQAVTTLWK